MPELTKRVKRDALLTKLPCQTAVPSTKRWKYRDKPGSALDNPWLVKHAATGDGKAETYERKI
jgi:hypothetical protein